MTQQNTDEAHYVGILEAVVAVLAIKHGINPKTLVAKAIEDITEQAGMETVETERIIRQRWSGRDLSVAVLASRLVPPQTSERALRATETAERVDAATRLQDYKKRQSEGKSDISP